MPRTSRLLSGSPGRVVPFELWIGTSTAACSFASIVDFLGDTNADVFVLQEVDVNARRTHHLNIAQEIARKLRLNYVFGREFVELTQGSKTSPAYHGQATLSRWKISKPRIIHFQQQSDFWKPRWFKPTLPTFQERLGGRIALAAEISIQGVSIICYNLHLESRSNDELRLAQLNEVLQDAGVYDFDSAGCRRRRP